MHESEPIKGLTDGELPAPELVAGGPSETELVIVALLMRLYDVQMALLSKTDKELADSIYDTHAQGGHFNPTLFIPSLGQDDEDTIGG